MINKTDEDEIQVLKKQLSSVNKHYYNNFMFYMRTHSFTKNNKIVDSVLLEILQDIIEAQSNGISAEDYFGKNPKSIANELLNELPSNRLDTIKLVFSLIVGLLMLFLFPIFLAQDNEVDIGKYVIVTFITVILIYALCKLTGWYIYRNNSVLFLLLFFLMCLIEIIVILGVVKILPDIFIINF